VITRTDQDTRPFAAPGQSITLGVGVGNLNGDRDAHSVVLTVRLPLGLSLRSASPAPSKLEGPSLVWNLGTLAAHAFPQTFDLNLVIARDAPGELSVSASVASNDPEENSANHMEVLPIVVRSGAAELLVESTLEEVALTVGAPVEFRIAVTNQGNTTALSSVLSLVLPPKVSFKSGDPAPTVTNGDLLTWQLDDIGPAAVRTIAVTIALDASLIAAASDHTLENRLKFTFDASTTTTQSTPANSHREIRKQVERAGSDLKVWLNVEGADNPGQLPVGKDVTYVIVYGNFGNAPAQKTLVSLSLWEGLHPLRAEPATTRLEKSDRFGGGVLSWDAGDIRVGQSSVVRCQVHVTSVPEDGSLVMAAISAPGGDTDTGNNVAYSYRRASITRARSHYSGWWAAIFVAGVATSWVVLRARRRRT